MVLSDQLSSNYKNPVKQHLHLILFVFGIPLNMKSVLNSMRHYLQIFVFTNPDNSLRVLC